MFIFSNSVPNKMNQTEKADSLQILLPADVNTEKV